MIGGLLGIGVVVFLLALGAGLWRRGAWVAPILLVGLHLLAVQHHVDDAGIDYAYARNLANGLGLVAQPGGAVVEGVSNPLWVGLLVVAEWMGISADWASGGLQLVCMLGVLALGGAVAKVAGADREGSGLVMLVIAGSGVVFAWTTAGLEGALLSLVLLGIALGAAKGWGIGVVFLVVLTAWVRPEGAVAGVAAAAAGSLLVGRWRRVGWALVGAFVGVAVLHGLRWMWLGTLVPNSVLAKTGGPLWRVLAGGVLYAGWCSILSGVWFLAVGIGRSRLRSPPAMASALVMAVALGLAVLSGGDWMRHGRFVAPYLPLVFAMALPVVAGASTGRRTRRIALIGLALTGGAVTLDAVIRPTVPMEHGRVRGALYAGIARDSCPDTSIATPDIGGVIWYHPELRIIDLVGLIDSEASRGRRTPGYWPERFAQDPPAVVDLHGGWARRTALSDATMSRLGYRLLGRRDVGGSSVETAPSLWLHGRCEGGLSSVTQARFDRWMAEGSAP